jgi:hypothetical protein
VKLFRGRFDGRRLGGRGRIGGWGHAYGFGLTGGFRVGGGLRLGGLRLGGFGLGGGPGLALFLGTLGVRLLRALGAFGFLAAIGPGIVGR